MKYIFLFFFTLTSLFAGVTTKFLDSTLYYSNTPIVDIRTPYEWKHDGVLRRAITIESFNDKGKFNQNFLNELNAKVDTSKPFALICRSGSRTKLVSQFLAQKFGYQVIDLRGGYMYLKGKNFPLEKR